MERYSRIHQAMEGSASGSRPSLLNWFNYNGSSTGLEQDLWKIDIGGGDGQAPESYPERPEEVDCLYYLRTGFCGFGASCRFNHPRDRLGVTKAMKNSRGDYPERAGQPVCQYYSKTGKCKFGSSCKYNHPSPGNRSPAPATLSIYGYPLRPGDRECMYYVKTGQCKFGVTCKFDHPLPSGVQVVMPMPGQAQPSIQSSQQHGSYVPGTLLSGSYIPGTYGPMLIQPGMISVPGWTSYTAPFSPAATSANTQATAGASSIFGLSQLSPSAPAYTGQYLSVPHSADHSTRNTNESVLPERPGMMECIYYMKTGVCRYGASCRFHHPPNWTPSMANVALNPIKFSLPPDAPKSSTTTTTTTDLKPESRCNKDTFLIPRVSSVSVSIGDTSVSNSSAAIKSRSDSSSSSCTSEIHGNDDVHDST